jgi:nicotinate-nucleotide pyrophosphorylase (carboxylating)
LSDAIIIKDNHIAIAGIENAIKNARRKASFTKKIEVEVESIDDAIKAAKLGVDIIMFDNMSPEEIKKAIAEVKKLGLRERLILEASGGINLANIASYLKTGVDVLSIGALIHSSPWLNFSLRVR